MSLKTRPFTALSRLSAMMEVSLGAGAITLIALCARPRAFLQRQTQPPHDAHATAEQELVAMSVSAVAGQNQAKSIAEANSTARHLDEMTLSGARSDV